MHERAPDPVVIFLPVPQREPAADDIVVDPVCGRTVATHGAPGRLRYGQRQHYFCSLTCAEKFAADPREFESR